MTIPVETTALAQTETRIGNLLIALQSSRSIAIAVGITMERLHISQEQALAVLRAHSRRTNRKVRDIAADIVHTGELPPHDVPSPAPPGTPPHWRSTGLRAPAETVHFSRTYLATSPPANAGHFAQATIIATLPPNAWGLSDGAEQLARTLVARCQEHQSTSDATTIRVDLTLDRDEQRMTIDASAGDGAPVSGSVQLVPGDSVDRPTCG